MFKYLIISFLMINFNLMAQEVEIEIQCKSFTTMIDDINSRVSSDKQLTVESCEESFETTVFGLVKKNFRSRIKLSSPHGLCSDAKFVEKHQTDLGRGVALGINYQRQVNALEAFGFMRGELVNFGGLIGVYLVGLHYPVCE